MNRSPDTGQSRVCPTWLVCVLLFVIYNSNLRLIRIDDSVPARLLPFSILIDGSVYLDGWVEPYLPRAKGPLGTYFVTRSHGHWVSAYPIVTSLVVLPLYLGPAWWLSHQRPPLMRGDVVAVSLVDIMEKLSASLIAALSAGILYKALRKAANPRVSLWITLIYGLASNTWTISSQSLWRQGTTELSFALLLWALLRGPGARAYGFWVGLALSLAAVNKPGNAVLAVALAAYFFRHRRRDLVALGAVLAAFGAVAFVYNLYFFGHLVGFNPNPWSRASIESGIDFSHSTLWHGFTGLLLSPNRGLLIYTPWTVFALWGAVRLWKEPRFGWERYLMAGMAIIFLGHARFWGWWGGWSYGPRYLTDLLPFLAFFLVPVWPRIKASAFLGTTFALALFAALFVQGVGAYCYPMGYWDATPVSVDRDARRLWDWSDNQVIRSLRNGPAPPYLFYEAYLLFGGPKLAR